MSEVTAEPPKKHQEAMIATVLSVTVTLIVTMAVGWFVGVFSRGQDAASEDQIRAVVKEMMVTDDEQSYAAALETIDDAVVRINTKVEGIEADVTDIRGAVRALARP